MDAVSNLAYGTVLTPPSPGTSGTSLVLQSGQGANFPVAPFDVALWASGVLPTTATAEIARCTLVSGNTLTLIRGQYGIAAQNVVAGYQVAQVLTANFIAQLSTAIAAAQSTANAALTPASAAATYAPLASPALTGSPTAPTQSGADNSTKLATTAYVTAAVSNATGGGATEAWVNSLFAPLASASMSSPTMSNPTMTGNPVAPTQAASDNSTKVATTAYVTGAISTAVANYVPLSGGVTVSNLTLSSPTMSGTPTAPTPVTSDNSTKVATTAYVANAITAAITAGIANAMFPVGSVYFSYNSSLPSILSGIAGSSWTQISGSGGAGAGRALMFVGQGSDIHSISGPNVTAGTGSDIIGEYNNTLGPSQIPYHYHTPENGGQFVDSNGTAGTAGIVTGGSGYNLSNTTGTQASTSGTSHNNVEPYFGLYAWRRTA